MVGTRRRSSPWAAWAWMVALCVVGMRGGQGQASSDGVGGKESFTADALLPALQRVSKLQGPTVEVAPILYIAGADPAGFDLLSTLVDVDHDDSGDQVQVAVTPFGESDSKLLAVVQAQESEDLVASPDYPSKAREVSASFAVASDVVYSVLFTDLLRGGVHFAFIQTALEQLLAFQAKDLLPLDLEAKTLHLVVRGVDEQDAADLELLPLVKQLLDGVWTRVLKPTSGSTVDGASLSNYVKIRVTFLPHRAFAEDRYVRSVEMLRSTLEEKLASQVIPEAASLESKLASLIPISRALITGASKIDEATVVSAYVLDKLASRYLTSFKADARRLQGDSEGYDEEFGRTFDDLIEKYLADFADEVSGSNPSGQEGASSRPLTDLGLEPGVVAAVVKRKREELRQAMLAFLKEPYKRQLQYLKAAAQEEFRTGMSSIKYQWELIEGFKRCIRRAKVVFIEGARKLVCKGARWKWDAELQSLLRTLQDQANDVVERTRAGGGFVPTRLRRPIAVQLNWLGNNFFHFLRDSSCDPLCIRTDSTVSWWPSLAEEMNQADKRTPVVSDGTASPIHPFVMNYILMDPDDFRKYRDPRKEFSWKKRVAIDPQRNHDDLIYLLPNVRGMRFIK